MNQKTIRRNRLKQEIEIMQSSIAQYNEKKITHQELTKRFDTFVKELDKLWDVL